MKSALTEFFKCRTTIAQSQELVDPDDPVLVACPYPPFKPSFFKEQGIGFHPYFWGITVYPYGQIRRKLEKEFCHSLPLRLLKWLKEVMCGPF